MVILTLGYCCYCCTIDNFVNIQNKRLAICTLLRHANKANWIERERKRDRDRDREREREREREALTFACLVTGRAVWAGHTTQSWYDWLLPYLRISDFEPYPPASLSQLREWGRMVGADEQGVGPGLPPLVFRSQRVWGEISRLTAGPNFLGRRTTCNVSFIDLLPFCLTRRREVRLFDVCVR